MHFKKQYFNNKKVGFLHNVSHVCLRSAAPSSDRRLFICLLLDVPTGHRPWQNGPGWGSEDLVSWMSWKWKVGCEMLKWGGRTSHDRLNRSENYLVLGSYWSALTICTPFLSK